MTDIGEDEIEKTHIQLLKAEYGFFFGPKI